MPAIGWPAKLSCGFVLNSQNGGPLEEHVGLTTLLGGLFLGVPGSGLIDNCSGMDSGRGGDCSGRCGENLGMLARTSTSSSDTTACTATRLSNGTEGYEGGAGTEPGPLDPERLRKNTLAAAVSALVVRVGLSPEFVEPYVTPEVVKILAVGALLPDDVFERGEWWSAFVCIC